MILFLKWLVWIVVNVCLWLVSEYCFIFLWDRFYFLVISFELWNCEIFWLLYWCNYCLDLLVGEVNLNCLFMVIVDEIGIWFMFCMLLVMMIFVVLDMIVCVLKEIVCWLDLYWWFMVILGIFLGQLVVSYDSWVMLFVCLLMVLIYLVIMLLMVVGLMLVWFSSLCQVRVFRLMGWILVSVLFCLLIVVCMVLMMYVFVIIVFFLLLVSGIFIVLLLIWGILDFFFGDFVKYDGQVLLVYLLGGEWFIGLILVY